MFFLVVKVKRLLSEFFFYEFKQIGGGQTKYDKVYLKK